MCRPTTSLSFKFRLALAFVITNSLITLPALALSHAARAGSDAWINLPQVATQTLLDSPSSEAPARFANAYGNLGMIFEKNEGQTEGQVEFLARGSGYGLFLTSSEAVFVLRQTQPEAIGSRGLNERDAISRRNRLRQPTSDALTQRVLRMQLVDGNVAPTVSGLDQLEGKVNYFKGDISAKWRTGIPTFARVHYANVYEGVDLIYYGNQQQLEYDFVVSPGADSRQIALRFDGADNVEVDPATGDLLLRVGETTLRQQKPIVYQEADGQRREVDSGYTLGGDGQVRFSVGTYDATRQLVIDPVLAYSTYLGGNNDEAGDSVAVDSAGNVYVAGSTVSTNFPSTGAVDDTANGALDVFVTKLNASGSGLVYSTYLGGSTNDIGTSIAIDTAGNAYVTGNTASANFPVTNAIQLTNRGNGDAFVTKLDAHGSALVYSTYLGGSESDTGMGIATDAVGNAYVAGGSSSTNFPVANAIQSTFGGILDVFVTKLNASGSALVYSSYLGGSNSDGGRGIAVDAAGSAYITGRTGSTDFPVANAISSASSGGGEAFVTKINSAGSSLIYSTFLGGNFEDSGNSIAVDAAGSAYVVGDTTSTDFPLASAIQLTYRGNGDAFVTKLNAQGSALVYSTYLGGVGGEQGLSIAVDAASNAYLTGRTGSTDFPVANAIQTTNRGNGEAFVTKLNAEGSALVYSTYLGGADTDLGYGIGADSAGNAYVTGLTNSTNFPATPDAFQSAGGGGFTDAFVFKIGDYIVAGRVRDAGGGGISDVTITLSGSNANTATSNAQGNFYFLDTTAEGSFVVTPFREGFTFNPSSFIIGNLNTNVPDIIFTGTATGPSPTPTPTPTITTFQFSAASYAVDEDDGKFEVTVTRSGDTSSAQTIDYATTDGTANDRRDYTTAIGRLHFAAGETAHSFDVFVTDDVYVEGNETIELTLSNPSLGAQLGSMPTTLLTIVDDDLGPPDGNPIDDPTFFVRQHYIDFLNREPDAAGLAFWIDNINWCGADQACRELKRVDTSAAFFLSIEFQETGFLVHRMTRAAFNRFPRYREFLRDSQEIGRDLVVGQGPWQALLEANKQSFADEFVNRSEFLAIYAGLSNEQYVEALNVNTANSLSQSERDALIAGLNNATETRATVLRKVAEDSDFAALEFRPAFVLAEYFGYLRRNPDDPPDTNFDGFNFWLAKLNEFNGDFRRADMVKAFLSSSEYRGRFGSP